MSRGAWKSSFPPNHGVQWSNTVGSTLWGMASGVVVVVDIVLRLAEIAPASCQSLQAAWSSLLEVRSSICSTMAFCGPRRSKFYVHQRWRGTQRHRTPWTECRCEHQEVRDSGCK